MTALPAWFWCAFPAVTMSLGWGLRGYIGGGSLGAMIPGAMVGLALCILLNRGRDAALIAAFAAVGVGFGGQETYGQTVHISTLPGMWAWGMTGFTLKGAVWGLLGGGAIGIALVRERFRTSDVLLALGLMVAGTWIGWKLVNEPKLIYFSNLSDKPRAELWAGLLLGGLLLPGWLLVRYGREARVPALFALSGMMGGGLGFGIGAAAHIWGRLNAPDFLFEWWKTMEFTFGGLFGLSLGYAAWCMRESLGENEAGIESRDSIAAALGAAAVSVAIGIASTRYLSVRFDYTIAGACLMTIALFSRAFSWQTAITTTVCAFALDLQRNRLDLSQLAMWSFVVAGTTATALYVARRPEVRPLFVWLSVSSVCIAFLKNLLLPPVPIRLQMAMVDLTFLLLVVVALTMFRYSGAVLREEVSPVHPRASAER